LSAILQDKKIGKGISINLLQLCKTSVACIGEISPFKSDVSG